MPAPCRVWGAYNTGMSSARARCLPFSGKLCPTVGGLRAPSGQLPCSWQLRSTPYIVSYAAYRDVGPVDGERTVFFGHANKAPAVDDRARRPFDPECNLGRGNTVAIRMSDEDAATWARMFDIALVTRVVPADERSGKGKRFVVQYYACDGVIPDCPAETSDGGVHPQFVSQEVQLNMRWTLTVQKATIGWSEVLNEQWVGDDGFLYAPWRENLRRELERIATADPGDM